MAAGSAAANLMLRGGAGLVLLMMTTSIAVVFVGGADPSSGNLDNRLAAPGFGAMLGTDQLGRDVLVRTLAGTAWSLCAALAATFLALLIGTSLALVAAELGGKVALAIELAVNSVITMPGLIIAIIVIAVIGQGWLPIVVTLGLITWPIFTRVILAETLSLKARDYVAASRLVGETRLRIVIFHYLPALRPTLLVMAAFHFADMLIAEGALSFLGLAAPLGAPTWGNMMADARPYVFSAPWMLLAPAAAIVVSVIAANLIGDGLASRFRELRT